MGLTGCRATLAALLVSFAPAPARAIEPLADFVTSARVSGPDNLEAAQLVEQRSGEALQAWGRALPALTARGLYTRNQYPVELALGPKTVTIIPEDQLDAYFTADVPLVDVASWLRIGAAEAASTAGQARRDATRLEVERAVAQRYYQVVAAEALVLAAERTLAAARDSEKIVAVRRGAGSATGLDEERARAEVERALQSQADVELLRVVGRRALQTLSGKEPGPGGVPLEDNLREEAPLASWLAIDLERVPSVRAAALERRAASRAAAASAAAFVPTVAATATERITNATGFGGNEASWTAGLVATLRLDVGLAGAVKAQNAAASGARVREDKARLLARDAVFGAWHQVRAQIAKSRAARAQVEASLHAAEFARERYATGAGTQLELIQAERDAFAAEVQRIQSDADLAYARAALRLGAGVPLSTEPSR